MKKEKYPERVEIFTFLLEYRFVWRPRFKKKQKTKKKIKKIGGWWFDQKMCLKGISCCRVFMVRGILIGKIFWMVNTWRAPVRKRLKRSILNFAHTFLTDCYTKLWLLFSQKWVHFLIAITRRALKAYFAWKPSNVDYSKTIWKEVNRGHVFVFSWLATYKWKNYWKIQLCWCRSP